MAVVTVWRLDRIVVVEVALHAEVVEAGVNRGFGFGVGDGEGLRG